MLACAALTSVGVARAQPAKAVARPERATLIVTRGTGADDCPAAQGFAERIRAITANRTLQTDPRAETDTWVYLEITHDLGRYSALLQTRGRQQGSRALSDVSSNCASLSDAVAVTLALLLDAREQVSELVTRQPRSTPEKPPRTSSGSEKLRYGVVLGGGVGLGLLAVPTPWATGGLEAMLGHRLRLGIGGAITLPQRLHYLQGYTELKLAWGYARGCALALRSESGVELMLCVSPMLGALSGSGKRYDFSRTKRWSWFALSGGAQASGPLAAPSFWWLSLMAVAPLTLRGFAITVDGEQHDTFVMNGIAATASLGLGVRF
jgi:hypothetical protein